MTRLIKTIALAILSFALLGGCQSKTNTVANLKSSEVQIVSDSNFNKYVDSCYDFFPHKIESNDELKKEILEADELFLKVESNKEYYFPLLRAELLAEGHNPYFYYDAGSLLMNYSKNNKDFEIVYKATLKANILDLNEFDFLRKVSKFALKGFDTYDFAQMVLDSKNFKVYLEDHALTLSKDYILLYILLPIDEKYYVDKLISRLENETDFENQLAIINVLGYSSTCKGDSAVAKYSNLNSNNERFTKRIERFKSYKHESQNISQYNKLIKRRNQILNYLSDEALYDFEETTKDIKKNYVCN